MARSARLKALLGAHCSAAGTFTKAIDRAEAVRAECLQIFTRAPAMWRGRAFADDEVCAFRSRVAASRYRHVLAHDIYLTNLAAADDLIRQRSIETLTEERERCSRLGVTGLVCHMGAHTGQGVDVGLQRFADGLGEVLRRTAGLPVPILLESSAGQGTCLGTKFADVARVLDRLGGPADLGVCVDTCHVFAAGYDLSSEEGYAATWEEFGRTLGFDRLRALHLNDSQRPLGSRVDRHAHIGQGGIGLGGFRRLLHDDRFAGLPMVIETVEDDGWGHEKDLQTLRRLRSKA